MLYLYIILINLIFWNYSFQTFISMAKGVRNWKPLTVILHFAWIHIFVFLHDLLPPLLRLSSNWRCSQEVSTELVKWILVAAVVATVVAITTGRCQASSDRMIGIASLVKCSVSLINLTCQLYFIIKYNIIIELCWLFRKENIFGMR